MIKMLVSQSRDSSVFSQDTYIFVFHLGYCGIASWELKVCNLSALAS